MIKIFIFKHYWRNIILFNIMAGVIMLAWVIWTNKESYTLEFLLFLIADIVLYRGRTLTFTSKGIYKYTTSVTDLIDISSSVGHEFIDFSEIQNLTINKSVLILNYLHYSPILDRDINRTLRIKPKNYNTTMEELLQYFPKNITVINEED